MCFCGKKATYSDIFWQVKLDGFRCVRHFLWKTFKLLHVLKYFSNSRLETFEFIKSWQFQHDWHSPFGYKRLCYSHATVGTFILNLLYRRFQIIPNFKLRLVLFYITRLKINSVLDRERNIFFFQNLSILVKFLLKHVKFFLLKYKRIHTYRFNQNKPSGA